MMCDYAKWFKQNGELGEQFLAVLWLLSFFKRPASACCLIALRNARNVQALKPLHEISDEKWNWILNQLADEHHLINLVRSNSGKTKQVSIRPLFREHFASRLFKDFKSSWTKGQNLLFNHLQSKEHQTNTSAEKQLSFETIYHGCEGNQHGKCMKIIQDHFGKELFEVEINHNVLEIKENLNILACFFEKPWTRFSPKLINENRTWLSNLTGMHLHALGRWDEAIETVQLGTEFGEKIKGSSNTLMGRLLLSVMHLTKGDLSEAEDNFNECTNALQDPIRRIPMRISATKACEYLVIAHTKYANALHCLGDFENEFNCFTEIENILDKNRRRLHPQLYARQIYRHSDFKLNRVERQIWQYQLGLTKRSSSTWDHIKNYVTIAIRTEQNLKELDYPEIRYLTMITQSRAKLYQCVLIKNPIYIAPVLENIETNLTGAIYALLETGNTQYLVWGLICRAWLHFLHEDYVDYADDLLWARTIAEHYPMPLLLADNYLTHARLGRLIPELIPEKVKTHIHDSLGSPQDNLDKAGELIHEHGYHLRNGELEDARG